MDNDRVLSPDAPVVAHRGVAVYLDLRVQGERAAWREAADQVAATRGLAGRRSDP